jgi:hypothetical protein
MGGLKPISPSACRAAGTPNIGEPPYVLPANTRRYVATVRYKVSDCAGGTFDCFFEVFNDPPQGSDLTRVINEDNTPLPFTAVSTSITVPVGRCCNGQNCLGNLNQFCCQTVNGAAWGGVGTSCANGCPCANSAECNDGLFCTGVETCVGNVCQPGTNPCTNPNLPNCNEATDSCVFCFDNAICDDGILCNGQEQCVAGVCQPGTNLPEGTPCGDPTDTDCTDPDTCNGFGACRANNAAAGTPCEDGLFCTVGTTCLSGNCIGGTPRNCSDGLSCTADSCNETTDMCENVLGPGFCLIDGVCYAQGATNPGNGCQLCNTSQSTTSWSAKPDKTACASDGNDCTLDECMAGFCTHVNLDAGTSCDDGDPCTGTGDPGIGFDECDGNGNCIGQPDPDCNDDCETAVPAFEGTTPGNNTNAGPDEVEASCEPNSNNDIWYEYVATCTGPVLVKTNGSSLLPSNDTVLSVYDACGGNEIACDDDGGPGLLSAVFFNTVEGESYFIRVAGFANNTGDILLTITTINDCVIDGQCYAEDDVNPANECEACRPDLSTTGWSPRLKGTACGDPFEDECNSRDACDGTGVCETNLKPDGTACTDDGNDCTSDFCSGGVCIHPNLAPGTACGSPADTECDNPDTCNGAGVCQSNYEPAETPCGNPQDTDCDNPDSCDGAGNCQNNNEPDGAICTDDGNQCTADVCASAICTHPHRPSGYPCGSPNDTQCDNPDTCNGLGFCDVNNEPNGLPCGDGDDCTSADACADGECIGVPVPQMPVVQAVGSRYLSVTPQPIGSPVPIALRITSPDYPCLMMWINTDGSLTNSPVFQTPAQWGKILVSGPQIIPLTDYEVEAECGTFLSAPGAATTWVWGDVNNDGFVDVTDVILMLEGYNSDFSNAALEAMDIAPCDPDGIIEVGDIIYLLDAYNSAPFPCGPPC